jgi:predicted lipoprotein with Yx(FWY)xxD motif
MNTKLGKQVVVDSAGKTVYLYEPDGSDSTSQVPTGIRSTWPAVAAPAGAPKVSSELDSSKVGTQTQPDGTKQISYNGHLLYTFAGDSAPGDAGGQGLGGVWFTISPAGEKIA